MYARILTAAALLGAAATAALGNGLPPGQGVVTANGSTFTTEIGVNDFDDYILQGFPGTTVTATVKLTRGSELIPEVLFLRPNGTTLSDDDGFAAASSPKGVTARGVLDATGWWQVRVRGADTDPSPTVTTRSRGGYSLTVKYKAPAMPPVPGPVTGFKTAGRIADQADSDYHRFRGVAGQDAKITLKASKNGLDPAMQLLAPDGTVAASAGIDDPDVKLTLSHTLDADGIWTVRIYGEQVVKDNDPTDVTTGPYSLAVKLSKATAPGMDPDANGEIAFNVPAMGGATLSYTLTWADGTPEFSSFTDPTGRAVAGFPGGTTSRNFRIPGGLAHGVYRLVFQAGGAPATSDAIFAMKLVPPPGQKKRKATLSAIEPTILADGIDPTTGGPGTRLTVRADRLIDPNADSDDDIGRAALLLDHVRLDDIQLSADFSQISGVVPSSLAEGTFAVVVESTTGQRAARANAFTVVPPPFVDAIDPTVGPTSGGFDIAITGRNFRPGQMALLIDGFVQPVNPKPGTETATSVAFVMPGPRSAGKVTISVMDRQTGLRDSRPLLTGNFEFIDSVAISRVVPSLTPVLGGDTIFVSGTKFSEDDKVYLELTPGGGTYEEITATQTTFVNSKRHQFIAPVRSEGTYAVYVQDSLGEPDPPRTRPLTYFTFADFTATTALASGAGAPYDAVTNHVSDFDQDGDDDLFVARSGGAGLARQALTRALRNDGSGRLTDVTGSVMPAVAADDDWRAHRIWLADVTQDGYPDLLLATNAVTVPSESKSHLRILANEQRTPTGPATDRVFRDRTVDLMAPVRVMRKYGYFGGSGGDYVSDNWRALDMWVGDIDQGPAGPPEILITHDEVKDDDNETGDPFSSGVYCDPYCSSTQPFPYNYTFYWGGSRAFVWDKSARDGRGRYRFEHNFFPRKSGPYVPQWGPVTIPSCSVTYGTPCKGKFTPFIGQRMAVGSLDGDSKLDVAVLSNDEVTREDAPISSLQVGMNRFNPADGALITDVTNLFTDMGIDMTADAVAIGQTGYPAGDALGSIAIAKAAPDGSGGVLRLFKYTPVGNAPGFEEITSPSIPSATTNEKWQASALVFVDVDGDGDQDLLLLASAPPGGGDLAFRVLRNSVVSAQGGIYLDTLRDLLTPLVRADEHFEGDALALGDLNDDGAIDFVMSRGTASGAATDTRVIITDKE